MNIKCRLTEQLKKVRGLSEGLLGAFKTPRDWTHQVHPTANHALWFVGHMATVDNFFISVLDPAQASEKQGYHHLFGMGSQPTNDPSAYPPVEEVLDYMRDRRKALLIAVERMSDDDLAQPVPDSAPDMFKDYASVLETAIWHETLHAGQVSVARRSLGNQPLLRP